MKSNLRTLTQKYNLDAPQMAQTLSSMGRKGDTLLAHITPQEAALLKKSGGAGTRNPRTGLLEFYDADGSGNAADSGNPTGGDGQDSGYGGGWGGGDWGGYGVPDTTALNAVVAEGVGPGSPGYGAPTSNAPFSNPYGESFSDNPNNAGGNGPVPAATVAPQLPANFNEAAYLAANPDVAAAVRANQMASGAQHYLQYGQNEGRSLFNEAAYLAANPDVAAAVNAKQMASGLQHYLQYGQNEGRSLMPNVLSTTTPNPSPGSAVPAVPGLNFASPSAVPGGASELSTLMRQYGIMAPSVMPSPSQFPATTAGTADAAKQEADKIAYQNYLNEYMNRLSSTDMYNRPQFLQDPSLFAPQWKDILAGPGSASIANTNQIYDMYNKYTGGAGYARGGRVGYAEGGEAEDPSVERSASGAMTPDQARRYRELMTRYMPSTNFGPQLATAQQAARSEAEAFSNMIRQMSERTESPTSRAEMYFRLASAFGAPTRTGQFTENLALAGREMGEVARGRRADEAERRALGLRAQELRMAGARQDLASLQALAGQESAERRAILPRIIEAEVRANTPSARERRINDMMETYNIDRQAAARIVDNVESVVTDPVTGMPQIVNRMTSESRPAAPRSAEAPATPPAAGAAPPATTGAPRGPAGESARPERTLYELASVPRTTGVLPAIGEGAQRVAGQVGANVVPAEFTERRQAFLNVQNEIIRAVINNPRFPIAEQERIRRELNIEPSMLTDPQTLLARIRALDSTLRTSLANREREGADTSLPVDARRGALQAANEARNLLQILGVPQEREEPAPRPQRRGTLRPQAQVPRVGQVVDGYTFLGGDPSDQNNWSRE